MTNSKKPKPTWQNGEDAQKHNQPKKKRIPPITRQSVPMDLNASAQSDADSISQAKRALKVRLDFPNDKSITGITEDHVGYDKVLVFVADRETGDRIRPIADEVAADFNVHVEIMIGCFEAQAT